MIDALADLLGRVIGDVLGTFAHTWPFLAISVVAAAAVSTYVGTERVSALLSRRPIMAITGAVLLATLTPFCSCGTMAVLLGMLATSAPWAPLVAFMVSSPLTSPSELFFSAGLLGWPFALVFFVGTIVLGLASGAIALVIERGGWLRGQTRMQSVEAGACEAPGSLTDVAMVGRGPGTAAATELRPLYRRHRLPEFGTALLLVGRRLLAFFLAFTAAGYLIIEAIPTGWLTDYLGGSSPAALPLAALLGIPAYLNTEASLPLLAALMNGGMGPGPGLAFLVTGAGTSLGAISGLLIIARRRVVGLVIVLLFGGAIALGAIGQLVL